MLYGRVELLDEVLVELIDSNAVQRLKWASQHGLPLEVASEHREYSRYEHSIGVMLLLRRFGASTEEQVAGLLHDVSHTAFSHVIDLALTGSIESESHNDDTLGEHISRPEIKGILLKHGLDAEKISKPGEGGNYSLLERALPDLCADRIDYSLRDGIHWYLPEAKEYLDCLAIREQEFVFTSRSAAKRFGVHYLKCNREYWSSTESRIRYYFLSKALKGAMEDAIIDLKDLYLKEAELIGRIRKEGTEEENRCVSLALGKFSYEVDVEGDVFLGRTKRRYVDPKFIEGGNLYKLSAVDEEFKNQIEMEREMSMEMRVRVF
jgi:uncharacterized protein